MYSAKSIELPLADTDARRADLLTVCRPFQQLGRLCEQHIAPLAAALFETRKIALRGGSMF